MNRRRQAIITSCILYALPVIFFIISYFLITTSGEDIWQGASSFRTEPTINPINDAVNAFNFNSRITDMYAWAVIKFFDYQFRFGPDFIFRTIDVILAASTFYLATYLILARKPKLQIKDALIFCATFLAIIIVPFGRPFYHEFSMIHNYVPLAFITLLFCTPFVNLLRNSPPTKRPVLLSIGMLLAGLYFGMAATITPLAFLATVILYCIIKRKSLSWPPAWFWTGVVGVIAGFAICWFAGSGIDHYTNPATAANFDYIAISDIFSTPATAIPKILWHEIYNFGITFLPLILLVIVGIIFTPIRRKLFTQKFYQHLSPSTKSFLLVCAIFIIIHLLGASLVKAPPRLIMPAYLVGVIAVFHFFTPHLNSKLLGVTIVIFTTITIILHTTFLSIYHHQTRAILNEIQTSPASVICLPASRTTPPRLPLLDLSQANILVDWGKPLQIHNKEVTFCK